MPPVLGPRSPSKTVLWSCGGAERARVVAVGRARRTTTSSPVMNSSTTTRGAGRAERAPLHARARSRASASSSVGADDRALARREPVGLDHQRARPARGSSARAAAAIVEGREARGRNRRGAPSAPWRRPWSSRCAAAAALGPEDGQPGRAQPIGEAGDERRLRAHHRPGRRRSRRRERDQLVDASSTHEVEHSARGARCRDCRARRTSASSRGLCASFQASACSRPPPPTSRTSQSVGLERSIAGSLEHFEVRARDARPTGCRVELEVAAPVLDRRRRRGPQLARARRPD